MRRALHLAVLAAGCATAAEKTLSERVDSGLVRYFPPEGRRWTYEAENEVIIALDRLDAARDHGAELEGEIARIEELRDKSAQGREVYTARLAWLERELELAESSISAAGLGVHCARASLELTKARLAVRFDLPVELRFVSRFEKQYDACAQKLEALKSEVEARAQKALEAKMSWRDARSEYVKRTGDHDHGLWIE